jgi:3-hydroxyisobutyrate dehydrogenase
MIGKAGRSIGFVGLGAMGRPMAANLVAAGMPVTVFDTRAEPVAELVTSGASSAPSLPELATRCDVVGVCVVDDDQVMEVVAGERSLLPALRPGSVVVLHSTIHPDTAREVHRRCGEHCVDVVEVSVSGFPHKAAEGTLTLMIGGAGELIEQLDPYLSAIGDHRFHLGPVGTGNAAKLANNVMWKIAMLGTFEGLNVARASGVDVDTMVEVALVSTGNSGALQHWKSHGYRHDALAAGLWEGGATLGGDRIFETALAIARDNGTDLPVVGAVLRIIEDITND